MSYRLIRLICTRLFFISFLLLGTADMQGQNLVINPGFEDTLQCPYFVSQIDFAVNWHTSVNTPDYYNACNNNGPVNPGIVGVPNSARGYQPARMGNAFAGVVIYWTAQADYREIFYAQLQSPLTAGVEYNVGMFTVLNEDNAMWAVDGGLGIYLSSSPINPLTPFAYAPQIANPPGNVLNDTLNWTEISGTYIATGGEQYITIGSFIPDNMLTVINRGGTYPFSSYAIEDVWVIPDSLMSGINIPGEKPEAKVFPNPSNGKFTLNTMEKNSDMIITDVTGKIIYKSKCTGLKKEIDMAGVPGGVYFCRLISKNQFTQVIKIIIQ